MRHRVDPSAQLLRLAQQQDGVISAAQAASSGLSRHSIDRLTRQGHWSRLAVGIYLTSGGPPEWRALASAGVLLGGDDARLGGLAAAHLHGLIPDPPDDITVMIPHRIQRVDRPPWTFHRERPGVRAESALGDLPRLTVEDTVLDLYQLPDRPGGRSPTDWLMAAVQQHKTTPRQLQRATVRRSRLAGRRVVDAVTADLIVGAQSFLEQRYLHDVERAHGLPAGHRQARRRAAGGERTLVAFRDVLYQEYGLLVELDGRPGHADEGRFRDLRRDNVSTLRGEATLRYGWEDVVEDTCLTAAQVGTALLQRGWPGPLLRCARCRDVGDTDVRAWVAG